MTNDQRMCELFRLLADKVALTPADKELFDRHLKAMEPKLKEDKSSK